MWTRCATSTRFPRKREGSGRRVAAGKPSQKGCSSRREGAFVTPMPAATCAGAKRKREMTPGIASGLSRRGERFARRNWWRRWESNPRPATVQQRLLRACSIYFIAVASAAPDGQGSDLASPDVSRLKPLRTGRAQSQPACVVAGITQARPRDVVACLGGHCHLCVGSYCFCQGFNEAS